MSDSRPKYKRRSAINQEKNGGVLIPFAILDTELLTLNEKVIYSYMLSFQLNDARCWCSSSQLAKRLGCCHRTAKGAVSRLLKLALIKRIKWVYEGKTRNAFECLSLNGAKIAQLEKGGAKLAPIDGQNLPSDMGKTCTYNNNTNNKENNKASPFSKSKEEYNKSLEKLGLKPRDLPQ